MKNRYVLIVEDDEWLASQQKRVIETAGISVEVANHALSAIQLIDKRQPDAIILDVLLAGSTAFALLHELQSYGDTGDIPIILCTNLANDLSLDELSTYGVKIILDKAKMVPDDLVSSLRSVWL